MISAEGRDLVGELLTICPLMRPTAADTLAHPWMFTGLLAKRALNRAKFEEYVCNQQTKKDKISTKRGMHLGCRTTLYTTLLDDDNSDNEDTLFDSSTWNDSDQTPPKLVKFRLEACNLHLRNVKTVI